MVGRRAWEIKRQRKLGKPKVAVSPSRAWTEASGQHMGCRLTCVLQRLDVLGSGRQLRHHLHELRPGFLVLLEH